MILCIICDLIPVYLESVSRVHIVNGSVIRDHIVEVTYLNIDNALVSVFEVERRQWSILDLLYSQLTLLVRYLFRFFNDFCGTSLPTMVYTVLRFAISLLGAKHDSIGFYFFGEVSAKHFPLGNVSTCYDHQRCLV